MSSACPSQIDATALSNKSGPMKRDGILSILRHALRLKAALRIATYPSDESLGLWT